MSSITYFGRINEPALFHLCQYIDNPNEIMVVRELFAERVWDNENQILDFIQNGQFWKSYFKKMFTVSSKEVFCKSPVIKFNICEKVCGLAQEFYGFDNPYSLTKPKVIQVLDIQHRLKRAISCEYDCVIEKLKGELNQENDLEKIIKIFKFSEEKNKMRVLGDLFEYWIKDLYRADEEYFPDFLKFAILGNKVCSYPELIEWGASSEAPFIYSDGEDGWKALHLIVSCGQIQTLEVFRGKGADLESKTNLGATPLHIAIMLDELDMVKRLIEYKVNLEAEMCDGSRPIHLAVELNRKEMFDLLLEKKVNLETQNEKDRTPLHLVAREKDFYIMQKLIDEGANLNVQSNEGQGQWAPLHLAVMSKNSKGVELLLKSGARTDLELDDGMSALHVAAESGQKDVTELLLQYGADIEVEGIDLMKPLHSAVESGNIEIISVLLDQGANPDSVDALERKPLDYLHKINNEEKKAAIRELFKRRNSQKREREEEVLVQENSLKKPRFK